MVVHCLPHVPVTTFHKMPKNHKARLVMIVFNLLGIVHMIAVLKISADFLIEKDYWGQEGGIKNEAENDYVIFKRNSVQFSLYASSSRDQFCKDRAAN